ncbi:MAG: signal peptide peptidase SppA, partial [Candidatus Marinamargulisbacteria bacterium]
LNAWGVGFARRSRRGVDWGVSYKSYTHKQLQEKNTYWSSDLGAIVHLNSEVDIGVVGKNILGVDDRPYSPSMMAGFLVKHRKSSLNFYSDLVVNRGQGIYDTSYVRYGVDMALTPDFIVRAGGDHHYYTGGASFNVSFLAIDYAMRVPKTSQHESVVALGVQLGRSRNVNEFRKKYALFKPQSLAYFEIDGSLTSGDSSISLLGGKKVGSNDIIQLIENANQDSDCQGYVIRIKYLDGDLSHIGLVQEIRSELLKGQQKGKRVYVFLDGMASLPSYYLASMADYIVMPPMGAIAQLGIKFELLKFDGAMKKFGIDYHYIQSGKHKVATSPFSPGLRMSQRVTIQQSLETIMATVKQDVQAARSTPIDGNVYDGRILSAQRAKDLGLIDHIGFWSDMDRVVREQMKTKHDVVLTHLGAFRSNNTGAFLSFNKVAVIEVNGPIRTGKNKVDILFGQRHTGADDIVAIFKRLRRDPFIKGVVLRVNSPGGTIVGADQIWHAMQEFKRITKKPVYASMGNIAASGGYYIVMGADQVFANPSTITGSIGVISGFLNIHEFEKKWGITSETLSTGKYMDATSLHQAISNDSLAMLHMYQYESYTHFQSLVQESRWLTDDEVTAVSQGQFMTGKEAHAMGLVDQLGSYSDTINALRGELNEPNAPVVVLGRPKTLSPFGWLQFLFD